MGRRRHGKKRKLQDGDGDGHKRHKPEWRPNERNYILPERKNEMFVKYYKGQNLVPEGEWEEFEEILKKDLPTTFRITVSRSQAQQLLKVIKGKFFNSLINTSTEEGEDTMEPPRVMPWYPDEMAWQINMSRKYIRSNNDVRKLHDFLVAETESGNISRQEAVSMIPPLLLDIQSHHKILDMCAAPGSKTAQLIEYLHGDNRSVPEGFVIANDADNKRCYLMVHQVKRLQSPNFIIVNEDATVFPKFRITPPNEKPEFMLYDRILADVPCTGDGTMRKNPDVWSKWKPQSGPNLHFLQLKILKRGLELLSEGGRLVYSTCSFNPIEDEAVVAEMLRQCKGAVQLVDVSGSLPGLKFVSGLSKWKIMSSEGEWFDVYDNVPKKWWGTFRPTMFPPTDEEAAEMHLERCMRILPHHQNTGGFFICALTKVTNLPWMKKEKRENAETTDTEKETSETEAVVKSKDNTTENCDVEVSEKSDQGGTTPSESVSDADKPADKKDQESDEKHQTKKRRVFGYKEDPFLFTGPDDKVWPNIKEFYGIPDDFPINQVMFRSEQGSRKNLYFVSKHIRTLVECNKDRVKFINMGMKLMSRNPSPIVPECDFRLNQECVGLLHPWFPRRYIQVTLEDTVTLLSEENPYTVKFNPKTQAQLDKIGPGSAVFHFKPTEKEGEPNFELIFCGWKGKVSLRSFVSPFDRQHYLWLCGRDLQEIRDKVCAEKEKKQSLVEGGVECDRVMDTDTESKAENGDKEAGEGCVTSDGSTETEGAIKVIKESDVGESRSADPGEVIQDT